MEAEIRLSYENKREAKAVVQAVSPDNLRIPAGLRIETTRSGSELVTRIRCDLRLQTLIATIDDLLSCVSIAEKAFSVAKEFEAHS